MELGMKSKRKTDGEMISEKKKLVNALTRMKCGQGTGLGNMSVEMINTHHNILVYFNNHIPDVFDNGTTFTYRYIGGELHCYHM